MKHRIGSARGSFVPNSKLLQIEDIDIKHRGVFLNRLVKSRFSYGCHIWYYNCSEISKLQAVYSRFL